MDPKYEVWDNVISELEQTLRDQGSETTNTIEEHPVINRRTLGTNNNTHR